MPRQKQVIHYAAGEEDRYGPASNRFQPRWRVPVKDIGDRGKGQVNTPDTGTADGAGYRFR